MTTIYKKVGRRYVEIGEFDNEYLYYAHGAHLVWSRPGGSLTHYRIEPACAAYLAAAEMMRDAMVQSMHDAANKGRSMYDIAQAGIDVLTEAVKK